MIYDLKQHAKTYKGISKNLDAALDYLTRTDMAALAIGRHSVDGERIVVHASSNDTSDSATIRYEAHRKYIDIQLVVRGAERCFYAPVESLEPDGPFADEKDVGYYHDPSGENVFIRLIPGAFALFFPHDAHKPSCHLERKSTVHKVVVKVAVD